jgi:hypothetical protein
MNTIQASLILLAALVAAVLLGRKVRRYLPDQKIRIAGAEIGIMDAVSAYLMQYSVGQLTHADLILF